MVSDRKPSGVKIRLLKKLKESRPVPTWVVVRTKRRVRYNPSRRSWRRRKLKVK